VGRRRDLERLIWADIERFLRDPGEIFAELDGHAEREQADEIAAAQAITLSHRLDTLQTERTGFVRLAARGSLTDAALDDELARIDADRADIELRLVELAPRPAAEPVPAATADLLAQLRARLDAGLSDAERHEVVSLLVRPLSTTTSTRMGPHPPGSSSSTASRRRRVDFPLAGARVHGRHELEAQCIWRWSLGDPGPPPEMV
jgi:hypothetical protein